MDSNLGGKQGGAGQPPTLTLAGLLYKEGRGGGRTTLEAAAPYPPTHHLLLHLTLAAPLSLPEGCCASPPPP